MIVGVQKTCNGVCLRLSHPSTRRSNGSLVAGMWTVNTARFLCPEKPYDLGCRKHPQVAENAKIMEDSLYVLQQPKGDNESARRYQSGDTQGWRPRGAVQFRSWSHYSRLSNVERNRQFTIL